MDDPNELLDLVDANDQKIGTLVRADIPSLIGNHRHFLRTSCALIRNSKGELWVPTRVANKKIAPNGLDFAMAEHMHVNESYLEAALRGFKEELNLTIQADDLRLLGILGPTSALPYFTACYLYETDTAPVYNVIDFTSAVWLKPSEVAQMLQSGAPGKLNLLPAITLLELSQ